MTCGVEEHLKPPPCVLIILAIAEQAAMTEGSSTAIGTL